MCVMSGYVIATASAANAAATLATCATDSGDGTLDGS
jgi:hypothetical protein